MRTAAILPAVLLIGGCASSPFATATPQELAVEGLRLSAQPAAATPGADVTLSLYNGTAAPVGQNLCFAALEQLRGGLWVPAVSVAKGCPEPFQPLEPRQQVSAGTPLPPVLAGGDYRIVSRVDAPLGSVPHEQVRSNGFTVE